MFLLLFSNIEKSQNFYLMRLKHTNVLARMKRNSANSNNDQIFIHL